MIKYFIAPYVSYKLFSLYLSIKIGNWFVRHVLGNPGWLVCCILFLGTSGFFFSKNQASLTLRLNQEGVNVTLALWTFAIPRWDIVTVDYIPILLWLILAHKLWGSAYFPWLRWVIECRHWQAGTFSIDNSSMNRALVSSIGDDLEKGKNMISMV